MSNDLLWRLIEFGLLFGLLSMVLRRLFPRTAGILPLGGSTFNEVAIILMTITFFYGVAVLLFAS